MTSTLLAEREIRIPELLAARTRELRLPGARSKTAITALRRRRQAAKLTPAIPTLSERLRQSIVSRYTEEIARRGGETHIETGGRPAVLALRDRHDGLVVLHASGWRQYSARHGAHPATLSYLCGQDDNGDWAVRIPGTITDVRAALAWITPRAVVEAQRAGRAVHRQGDVYAIATTAAHDAPTGWVGEDWRSGPDGGAVTSHRWDATTRTLTHQPADDRAHAPLHLPHPVRFVQQSTYAHGRLPLRGSRTTAGD